MILLLDNKGPGLIRKALTNTLSFYITRNFERSLSNLPLFFLWRERLLLGELRNCTQRQEKAQVSFYPYLVLPSQMCLQPPTH